MDRRDFMLGAGLSLLAMQGVASAQPDVRGADTHGGDRLVLPPLPYAYDALEPFIDAETMTLHHDKHHAGYVKGFNRALDALEKARESGDFSLVQHWSRQLAFHGGGHYLHSLFWRTMGPEEQRHEPSRAFLEVLQKHFGGLEGLKSHLLSAAKAVEGSGWGMLYLHTPTARLLVGQVENQHKLSNWGSVPLLAVDVWEHAYYLNYRNNRQAYLEAWWQLINWKQVEQEYLSALNLIV